MAPIFDELSKPYTSVTFINVDVGKAEDIARAYDIYQVLE